MKKILLSLFCVLTQFVASQNLLKANVDERIELASAFCYAVGFENIFDDYIESYFNEVKKLAIKAKSKRIYPLKLTIPSFQYTIENYKLIVEDALCWKIENGNVISDLKIHSPLKNILSLEEYKLFIDCVNKFYNASLFSDFFISNKLLYLQAEQLYDSLVLSKYEPQFYLDLFGKDNFHFNVYVSLLNGNIHISSSDKHSVIMGGLCDKYGPNYDYISLGFIDFEENSRMYHFLKNISDLFISEFIHDYISSTKNSSMNYYKSSVLLFERNHYDAGSLFKEQLCMLMSLLYFNKLGIRQIDLEQIVIQQKMEGFIWQNEMWNYVKTFDNNRSQYPYFQDFLPSFVSYYRTILSY